MRPILNLIVMICSYDGVNTNDLKTELNKNKAVFESVAQGFLKQERIEWISTYSNNGFFFDSKILTYALQQSAF